MVPTLAISFIYFFYKKNDLPTLTFVFGHVKGNKHIFLFRPYRNLYNIVVIYLYLVQPLRMVYLFNTLPKLNVVFQFCIRLIVQTQFDKPQKVIRCIFNPLFLIPLDLVIIYHHPPCLPLKEALLVKVILPLIEALLVKVILSSFMQVSHSTSLKRVTVEALYYGHPWDQNMCS